MNYEPYREKTAGPIDRVAWALCQIIDDDAPLRWTRYRFAAECIAMNSKMIADLHELKEQNRVPAPTPTGDKEEV